MVYGAGVSSKRMRLLGKIAGLGPAGWRDCVRATIELALANRRLGSRSAQELLTPQAANGKAAAPAALSDGQAALVARVAFAVPRVGAYLPWRSDCLVQALAAQRWLASKAVKSEICIGVRKPADLEFEAHAWLEAGGTVVTGGDISGYTPLYAPANGNPSIP